MKKMNFTGRMLPIVMIAALMLLSACNGTSKLEKAFALSETEVTMMVGETKTLTLDNPKETDVGEYTVEWSSEDETVASVSEQGTVTAKLEGTTTITALLKTEKAEASFSATVTVTKSTASLTAISFGATVYSLGQGQTLNLEQEVEYTPAHAANKDLKWTSSNPDIATVANGVVTPRSQGITTITAKTTDGMIFASCTVRVSEISVPATGISLEQKEYTVSVGKTVTATPKLEPSNATGYTLVWATEDPEIATVTGGKITGINEGETTLFVYLSSNEQIKAQCKIIVEEAENVVIKATNVKLSSGYITIPENNDGPFYFYYEITPLNCTESPRWSTNRPDLLKIDEKTGKFTLIKAPTDDMVSVIVTCTVGDVSTTGVVNIEPRKPVLEIVPGETGDAAERLKLYDKAPYNTLELIAVLKDIEALPDVTWKSSDNKIATVDANGMVTAKKAGKCTITAISKDDTSVKAEYTVTVEEADYLTVAVGSTVDLALDSTKYPNDISWQASKHLTYDAENKTITGKEESSLNTPGGLSGYSASDGKLYSITVHVLPAESE